MLTGTVKFRARIVDVDKEVTFPVVEFNPNEPGVGKVEIKGPNGTEILTAVHLAGVDSPTEGIAVATKVHMVALDRISFRYDIALENGRVIESGFSPVDDLASPGEHRITPGTGHYFIDGQDVKFKRGLSSERLKTELEQPAPPGEHNFRLFRSARQSTGAVEEFMHLYNILLMFFDDDQRRAQRRLDDFIRTQCPGVPQTPHPFYDGVNETVYTRLRNELGHHRKDSLDETKAEMAKRLGELIALTKQAIESRS
jgi:hypothetical protein